MPWVYSNEAPQRVSLEDSCKNEHLFTDHAGPKFSEIRQIGHDGTGRHIGVIHSTTRLNLEFSFANMLMAGEGYGCGRKRRRVRDLSRMSSEKSGVDRLWHGTPPPPLPPNITFEITRILCAFSTLALVYSNAETAIRTMQGLKHVWTACSDVVVSMYIPGWNRKSAFSTYAP